MNPDVIVVGAGLSGLAAAGALAERGRRVLVLDKGRSVGGRLATRRIGGARLDHGAQFMTVRSDGFAARMDAWEAGGLTAVWYRGPDGNHPRHLATAGMNSLAKDLTAALPADLVTVECSRMVFSITPDGDGGSWNVLIDDGTGHSAPGVIITSPVPQTMSLLADAHLALPADLATLDYHRSIALLVVLDGPSAVPPPGVVPAAELDGGVFGFVADQQAKGVSAEPAVTLRATDEWSLAHWDLDPDEAGRLLLEAAQPWLGGAAVVEHQVKRWRLATPQRLWPEPCWSTDDHRLVLAGDAFSSPTSESPNAEGAWLSGMAAAEVVTRGIPRPPAPDPRSSTPS